MHNQEDILKQIDELQEISQKLEMNAKLAAKANNIIMAQQASEKVETFQKQQDELMGTLVKKHPDPQIQKAFFDSQAKMDLLKKELRDAKAFEEIQAVEAKMDQEVKQYIHNFQIALAHLIGKTPPKEPMFD